ncbi:MAG: FAD binding domain-containing protein, partial [Sulfitobacter sp.]
PAYFLDVTRIHALNGVSVAQDTIRIGATTTWTQLVNTDLPPAFDALKQAARAVGSLQIQNAGTIAGNICNASPAADGVPPLLALDARVELASAARGTRSLPLADFILGVRQTALAPDELMTAIVIPAPSATAKSAFEKLGSRKYLVISISMVAAVITADAQGRITQARIAVGACSAVAQRMEALEQDIIGKHLEDISITPEHLAPLSPITDVRGSGDYRLDVVTEQCLRAVQRALA